MSEKIVYLMRGLPSSGKSHTARKLAGDTGVVCETDEYFYTQVGDDPTKFDYRKELMEEARRWNFERFKDAVHRGVSPIVVDRGNSRSTESQQYARYAIDHGYDVELREPDSEWWQEIRVLLKYKKLTKPALYEWAQRLSEMNRTTHRVPASTIRTWMNKWKWDLTVDDILSCSADRAEGPSTDDGETTRSSASTDVESADPESADPGSTDAASTDAQTANYQRAEIDASDRQSTDSDITGIEIVDVESAEPLTTAEDLTEPDTPLTSRILRPGEKSPFL